MYTCLVDLHLKLKSGSSQSCAGIIPHHRSHKGHHRSRPLRDVYCYIAIVPTAKCPSHRFLQSSATYARQIHRQQHAGGASGRENARDIYIHKGTFDVLSKKAVALRHSWQIISAAQPSEGRPRAAQAPAPVHERSSLLSGMYCQNPMSTIWSQGGACLAHRNEEPFSLLSPPLVQTVS